MKLNSLAAAVVSLTVTGCAPGLTGGAAPVEAEVRARLQASLDSLHATSRFPGISVAVALRSGAVVTAAAGIADSAAPRPLRPRDRLMAGSVGKTFVAAVAMQLVREGRLALDAPISTYLAGEPWLARLPNADQITVRMLMNHTSGLVRYEYGDAFLRDLNANPTKSWTPGERVAYLHGTTPPFAAGRGWEYSDTNYIVLGAILERLSGTSLEAAIERRVLRPLGLDDVVPANRNCVPGVVQGYAGPENRFGNAPAMLRDGCFIVNPQFEWAGGGYATTPAALARWARLLFEGKAYDPTLLAQVLSGAEAPALGAGVRYGLGAIIRDAGPAGRSYGHSGFFPGYLTDVRYYPDHGFAVAVQMNTSTRGALAEPLGTVSARIAGVVAERLGR